MLDYAANGVKNWPVERLRADLALRLGGDEPAADAVADLLDRAGTHDLDAEAFWSRVEDNLRLGRLQLLFVADVIAESLRSIIEFLNEQMTRCEVLGVEIRQYRAAGQQIMAPSVVGHTSDSLRREAGIRARPFDELLADAGLISEAVELKQTRVTGLTTARRAPPKATQLRVAAAKRERMKYEVRI